METTRKSYKCDSSCIHHVNKDCITEDEDGLCDRPDEYKEIGDVAEEVLSYAEYVKLDDKMPYSAYLQGLVEDGVITPMKAQELLQEEKEAES